MRNRLRHLGPTTSAVSIFVLAATARAWIGGTTHPSRLRQQTYLSRRWFTAASDSSLLSKKLEGQSKKREENHLEKCLLVGVELKHNNHQDKYNEQKFTFQESVSEMTELLRTAGLSVAGLCVQQLPSLNAKSYVGSGKLAEICQLIEVQNINYLVVDDDLTPRQQKTIEEYINGRRPGREPVTLLDRTAIILEIFSRHARSKEGKLQVELATLQYRLSRLGVKRETVLTQSDTGEDVVNTKVLTSGEDQGFRGAGETRMELDKRYIKWKIGFLKKEIDDFSKQRERHRLSRDRLGLPVVSLVGYTNAGKSTIFNRLSSAGVLAEDKLFATLDPIARRVKLSMPTCDTIDTNNVHAALKYRDIMLTDTVGFISKLPAHLVAAFRSTLEEAVAADVIVHVVDRSNPNWSKQRQVVQEELKRIFTNYKSHCAAVKSKNNDENVSVKQPPTVIEIWNKVDLISAEDTKELNDEIAETEVFSAADSYHYNADSTASSSPPIIQLSAKTGIGFNKFIELLSNLVTSDLELIRCFIPYSDAISNQQNQENSTSSMSMLGNIYRVGQVYSEEHNSDGITIECKVPKQLLAKLVSKGWVVS